MKLKTILLSAFALVAGIGAIGGTAAYLINKNKGQSSFLSLPTKQNGSVVKREIFNHNFSAVLTKHTSEDEKSNSYTINIDPLSTTEKASIYFITETKSDDADDIVRPELNSLTFKPGETVKVGVKYNGNNEGKEKITVRDLLVWGVNDSHFVKTVDNKDGTYSIKMPEENEALNMDGSSWLYGEDVQITLKATYIKESIGEKTRWTHGAFFGDLNGYVYNFEKDFKWSELKSSIYVAYENSDKSSPIDIYVYLNGFTLTVDEEITKTFIPSGWALHIYNNETDSVTSDGKYGSIVPGEDETRAVIQIGGSLALGRSVKYITAPSFDGVRILKEKGDWIGININDPQNGGFTRN